MDDFFERLSEHFQKHEEQAFILKAFLTITLILILRETLSNFIGLFILFFPFIFLIYVRLQSISTGESPYEILKQHITFMPVMYAEGERKKETVAWATYALILINIAVFYVIEDNPLVDLEFIAQNFTFLPEKPNFWNIALSPFSAMFLHAGNLHLWGNMTFLWVVGTVVEPRIGTEKFLLLYFITGLLAGITFVIVHYLFLGVAGHSLGASGAIAGIMGIYSIRCYFKSMVFPLPILGIFSLLLPISLKVRLNSLVLMGLFFLMDLSGGIEQISGGISSVAHWAHIGGMISGMVMAGIMDLGKGAIEEKHLEIGIKTTNTGVGLAGAEHSLKIALEKNPNNAEALLYLARIKSKYSLDPEGAALYEKAISILAASKPLEAASIYKEFYNKYMRGVSPSLQYRVAGIFYKNGDLDMSTRCLEILIESQTTTPEIKERALYQCAGVLEEMGLLDAAKVQYERFMSMFPNAPAAPKVKAKLVSLR